MNLNNVLWVLGLLMRPLAVLLLLPAAIDFGYGNMFPGVTFVATAVLTALVGVLLTRAKGRAQDVGRIEAMAIVASAWLMAAVVGSVPYMQQGLSLIDSLFESMSGFTTTGSTILLSHHWDQLSEGLFFWRAMTQWLGGMGIIVLFVAVLPALAVAGRQMFFAEAPGPEDEALTPRIRHTAMALWRLYIGLTILEALLLWTLGGMTLYEGVCHAFTTLAAGGFSPNGRSLAGYGAAAQWIVIPFMFLAGASFALQYRALRRPKVFTRDTEFLTYASLVLLAGLTIAVIIARPPGHDFEASLRHGLFQAASILTTTGYASEDYNLWAPGALMVLGSLMFIGGCAGSAGGGPKVIRVIVLMKYTAREVLIALHPRAVRLVRVGGRPVPRDTMRQITGFFVAYVTIFSIVAIVTGVIENDFNVGLTGTIATLGNIGPGFGVLGPMETFGTLSTSTKLLFLFTMWVGRLEVMTVLVLFHPDMLRTVAQQIAHGLSRRRQR